MADGRSLAVQSVLYGNPAEDIVRAAASTANSVRWAREAGLVTEWTLLLGDCSPAPVLHDAELAEIRRFVESQAGEVRYEVFGENLGHGGGHNRLAASGATDLLLFLNPDATLGPDSVLELCVALAEGVGVVDARQLPLEHPKTFDAVTGDTSWASGACSLTRRDVFMALDGFDDSTFFMYCDDVDYSWRVRLAGHRVVHAPSARLFHDKRLTIDGDWQPGDAEVYYSAEAAILLAYKYSRNDIAERILKQFRKDGSPVPLKAVAEFERRERDGRLPAQLDPHRRVGQFVRGNYAEHRF